MAIYLGNNQITGTTNISLGSNGATVYMGSDQIYPGQVTYVLSNVNVVYSSGSYINAAGTNYAYITGTVKKYIGGQYIETLNDVKLEPHKISGSYFSVDSNGYIRAEDRANVSGAIRSATFYATYYSVTSNTQTVNQAKNDVYYKKKTISVFSPILMTPNWTATGGRIYNGNMGNLGGEYFLCMQRKYYTWEQYDSGYSTRSANTTSQTTVTAVTYTNLCPSTGTCWLTTSNTGSWLLSARTNTTYTADRSQTISCMYSADTDTSYYSASYTVLQYGKAREYYDYSITANSDKYTWEHNDAGTAYTATITADCKYRVTHIENGSTSSTSWITYNSNKTDIPSGINSPIAVSPRGHYKVFFYDGSTGGPTTTLYYATSADTYGSARFFPYSANLAASDDIDTSTYVQFGDKTKSFTFTHKGDGTLTISPTSLLYGYGGGSQKITVTTQLSSSEWYAQCTSSWVTLATASTAVTATTSEYTSTTTDRSATIYFKRTNGETLATCSVVQKHKSVSPGGKIGDVDVIYELGDGWYVGTYVYTVGSPLDVNQIAIVREDAGSDTHFSFDSSGYYSAYTAQPTSGGTLTNRNWLSTPLVQYGLSYTSGTVLMKGTTSLGCYGVSITGGIGIGATTGSGYAKITIG